MIPYNAPLDDMAFLLHDLGMLSRVSGLPGYEQADAELVDGHPCPRRRPPDGSSAREIRG